jgi:predicted nucleic acid-binding protein
VSLVEITYLVERQRVPPDTLDRILAVLRRPNSDLVEVPFDSFTAEVMRLIPARIVPDMPDRMIAATALYWNIPLVTADRQLQSLPNLTCIW